MANSDYIQSGGGSFCSIIELDAPLGYLDTVINYTQYNFHRDDAIEVGMTVLCDDEIMRVDGFGPLSITVRRGCADTVPQQHAADAICWCFTQNVGGDNKEWSAGEVIGVKVSPYSVGDGSMDIALAAPDTVGNEWRGTDGFDWRYFRPYPPGQMKTNNANWFNTAVMNDALPDLFLSWANRDRVLQSDQLIGHFDASIGPEPGTTYTMRVYHWDTGLIVRTEPGITATSYIYQHAQAMFDQGNPLVPVTTYLTFTANRDGFDAWQWYACPFTIHPIP